MYTVYERWVRWRLNRRGVRSLTAETPVGRVHYLDAEGSGEAPPVVLLHGIGSSAVAFAELVLALRPHGRRVIAIDAPGHGFSDIPESPVTPHHLYEGVAHVLADQPDEPFVLFGNSLGGAMATRFALDHPERVASLVLCSPAGAPVDREDLEAFLESFRFDSDADAQRFLERLFHRPPWFTRVLGREVRRRFDYPHIRDLLDRADPDDALEPAELASLSMPVRLVWGASERLMPDEHRDFFRRHLPEHAEVLQPEGFGHCPQLEHPAELARLIVEAAPGFSRAA